MTEESLKGMEPRIVALIEKFVALLGEGANDEAQSPDHEGWSPPRSFQVKADWLTFDVMSDLLYGKPLGLLDSPDARWLPSSFRKISQLAATVCVSCRAFRACRRYMRECDANIASTESYTTKFDALQSWPLATCITSKRNQTHGNMAQQTFI